MDDNFYALSSLRPYPLDDAATGISDNGLPLPPNILVDCSLRFPNNLGASAFVSAVTVTSTLVTILFEAVDSYVTPSLLSSPAPSPVFRPLGSISITQPTDVFTAIPLVPASSGVGGWVVLGSGIDTPYWGRFTTPSQGALLLRCARNYLPLPVLSLGRLGSTTTLQGTIALVAGTAMSITLDQQVVEGVRTPAVAFNLQGTGATNPLATFIGPCGARPESGTCVPPSITGINDAIPDSTGNIKIDFVGASIYPFVGNVGGVAIDQRVLVQDLCAGKNAAVGVEAYDTDTGAPAVNTDDDFGTNDNFVPQGTSVVRGILDTGLALGILDTDAGLGYQNTSGADPQFTVVQGNFVASTSGYQALATDVICIAVQTRDPAPRLIRAKFIMEPAGAPVPGMAGVVFGCKGINAQPSAYLAMLDAGGQQLALYQWDGTALKLIAGASLQMGAPATGTGKSHLMTGIGELRVGFGDPTADSIRSVPDDQKIPVTIEYSTADAFGHLLTHIPTNDGAYGVAANMAEPMFLELHGEDLPSAS